VRSARCCRSAVSDRDLSVVCCLLSRGVSRAEGLRDFCAGLAAAEGAV
jgi:hypothetical protein